MLCNWDVYFFTFSDIEMSIPTSCASTADGSNDGEQPETDYIKMFVGQIPRAMNEQDLMDMFGEFGRVYQLNLLRDKFSGVSKGKILRIPCPNFKERWSKFLLGFHGRHYLTEFLKCTHFISVRRAEWFVACSNNTIILLL